MHRKWLSGGMGLGFVIFCALAIAAVPGFFQSVDSTSGYTVAGSAGSSGQVLCSDGTHFNTPCNPSGSAFYQTVTGTAGDTAQRGKLGFSANFHINDLSGFNETEIDLTTSGPGTGTFACPASLSIDSFGRVTAITASTCPTAPPFTGSSGFQVLPSGLTLQWGTTPTFDTGPVTVTFPTAFSNGCLMKPVLTDDNNVSTGSRIWSSGSCTTTGFTARNDGSGAATYFVIGW